MYVVPFHRKVREAPMRLSVAHLLTRLRSSVFVRNIATLTAGSVVAQLIPLASSPVLTRLYSPIEYGHYARFMLLVTVLSGAATGRYEMAILAAGSSPEVRVVKLLARLLAVGVSALVLFAAVGLRAVEPLPAWWVWLLPAGVLVTAAQQVSYSWLLRERAFRLLSSSRAARALLVAAVSISVGVLGLSTSGLALGAVLGSAAIAAGLFAFERGSGAVTWHGRAELRGAAMAHRQFPLLVLPSEWLSTLALQLPLLFLDVTGAGFFSFATTVVSTPLSLIGTSVLEGFKERAFRDYRERGSFRTVYRGVFFALVAPATAGAIALAIGAPVVFRVAFGARWEAAGVFAASLAPMFALRLLASPLSYTYVVVRRQREAMLLQAYALGSSALVLLLGRHVGASDVVRVLAFGMNYALVYVIFLLRTWSLANAPGSPRPGTAAPT